MNKEDIIKYQIVLNVTSKRALYEDLMNLQKTYDGSFQELIKAVAFCVEQDQINIREV